MNKGYANGSTSSLSKEIKFEGDIQGSENLQVEGRLKGSIKLSGDVIVGPTGIVEADVEADNIVIQGRINGNVLARKQLQIQSSGRLVGDCTAQSIDIKEGAYFEGRSKMLKSAGPSIGGGTAPGAKS
jgi:cytoskeletal protein CcmA (bactofilin family)